MRPLSDLDWARIAMEAVAFVRSDWLRSAIVAGFSRYRLRATQEERHRIARLVQTEAKLHRAKYSKPRAGAVDLGPLLATLDRPGQEDGAGNLFKRKSTRAKRAEADPLTEHDWENMALLAEALEAVEFLRAVQLAELERFRARGTSGEREQITTLMRAAKRGHIDERGSPSRYAPVVGDALREAGDRGAWWAALDEIKNKAFRRQEAAALTRMRAPHGAGSFTNGREAGVPHDRHQ